MYNNAHHARVSSVGQDHAAQVDRLNAAGATKIFQEKRSGVDREREELKKCLDYAREGDTLLVTKLDRLARSAIDLLNIVQEVKGVAFTSGAHWTYPPYNLGNGDRGGHSRLNSTYPITDYGVGSGGGEPA